MKTLFEKSVCNLLKDNFEVLSEKEMGQLKGGTTPDGKDVFDPDEH